MFAEMWAGVAGHVHDALTYPDQLVALVSVVIAGGLVLVSSFVKTMIPLRWLAIGSNLGFVAYGAIHPSLPMLALHAALLPINVFRLAEMIRLTRRVRAVQAAGELSGVWLKPYMRSARLRAGTVLFRQGDQGDRLYLLADGRVELVEIGTDISPGQIFGEIAFFSPDRSRRLTARCAEDSTVLSIDESTVRQLYIQNPAFGYKMVELVAARFAADVDRLNQEVLSLRARKVRPDPGSSQPAARDEAID